MDEEVDRVRIPKTERLNEGEGPAWDLINGQLWIRCKCGQPNRLDHEIAPNGDLNPSLFHDDPACGWHVWATLEGWNGGYQMDFAPPEEEG